MLCRPRQRPGELQGTIGDTVIQTFTCVSVCRCAVVALGVNKKCGEWTDCGTGEEQPITQHLLELKAHDMYEGHSASDVAVR